MKNRLHPLLFLLFVFTPLAAEEEPLVIDSGYADYDGKKITLSGDVTVEHEIGTISANHMVLTSASDQKKTRFAHLAMEDSVKIALKDGGQLCCSQANLDYQTLLGKFFGDQQQEYVVYIENCRDKGGARVPLVVKSKQMELTLGRDEEKSSSSPKSFVKEIVAEDHVTINYNHDFVASSDIATYQRLPSEKALTGLISLRSVKNKGICQVTNRNGDLVHANQISIDTQKRNLHFAFPKGSIVTASLSGEPQRVDFSSDSLTWDEAREMLSLHDNIIVNQEGIGNLTNNQKVNVYQHKNKGKKQLRCIESLGETALTYTDEEKGFDHTVTTYGKMFIDHENLTTALESPMDENGCVLEEKQVHFYDHLGEIFADKATLNYEESGHSIKPIKLTLEGRVHLLNRKDTESFLQYAISDKVEYHPKTKEMILSANPGNRVLFFDKINNIQVSAPKLTITRDPKSNKDHIKGSGDVRFSFLEQEIEQLRKQFGDVADDSHIIESL